jgi:hypothetical protein
MGLVARFDDHIQRVFATYNGFALDTDSVLANVGAAQIIEEGRSHIWIGGRTTIRFVMVTDDEESHDFREASIFISEVED